MSVAEIVKRIREGLELTDQEAQQYLQRLLLTVQVDDLYAGGDAPPRYAAHGFNFSTALAANYSIVQLLNPSTSGVICSIKQIHAFGSAGLTLNVRQGDTGLGAATGNEQWSDRRTRGTPALEIRSHQAAAVGGSILLAIIAPSTGLNLTFPAELGPGQGLVFAPSAQNQNLYIDAWWEERPVRAND